MFAAYSERRSVPEVAKKFRTSPRTVRRYRVIGKWDDRADQIQRRAAETADYNLAKATAQSIEMVREYKGRLSKALARKDVAPDDVDAQELERLISLEQRLLGGGTPHQTVYFAQVTALLNQPVAPASGPLGTRHVRGFDGDVEGR